MRRVPEAVARAGLGYTTRLSPTSSQVQVACKWTAVHWFQSPPPAPVPEQEQAMNARTRRPAGTHSPRVRPHTRRRDGIIEGPREHAHRDAHHVASSYGYRPFSG